MDQTTLDQTQDEIQVDQTRIDFKMVTFTLAGKDYGIDIMKVKEISKAFKFTFVPNSAPYVKGVYNLRGDIISVIDLRLFFHLPINKKDDSESVDMVILRLDDQVVAIIVDTIDKVIGVSSETIQPPHPLFGDINIKYISGIAENAGRLYVVLDMERIFGPENTNDNSEHPPLPASENTDDPVVESISQAVKEDIDIGFIEETLVTFFSFHSTMVQDWIKNRLESWREKRGEEKVQLESEKDAEAFLAPFWSSCTGRLWTPEYLNKVASLLPEEHTGNYYVWNPGCGGGHESYSVACMVKKRFPAAMLKMIAHDKDLIRISTAPGLQVDSEGNEEPYKSFLADGIQGKGFNQEVKSSILFEYHDIMHDNTLPRLDLVVARDTLPFLPPDRQEYIFSLLAEIMKPGGLLLLGDNERLFDLNNWDRVEKAGIVMYKKRL